MAGLSIAMDSSEIFPSSIDASEGFFETALSIDVEQIAREIVLYLQGLEQRALDDGEDAWSPFTMEDIAAYAPCDDEAIVVAAIEKMVRLGLISRDESGMMHVQPPFIAAIYRYVID